MWAQLGPLVIKRAREKGLVEKGVILTDISSQDIFYLFLLESSFDYKLVVTIYWATNVKEKLITYLICWRHEVLKQARNTQQDNDVFLKTGVSQNYRVEINATFWRHLKTYRSVAQATAAEASSVEIGLMIKPPSQKNFMELRINTCLSHRSDQDNSLVGCDTTIKTLFLAFWCSQLSVFSPDF